MRTLRYNLSVFLIWKGTFMSVNKEQFNRLRLILEKEYGFYPSEESLLSESIRLSEFAKTIINHKLKNKNEEK